jgi:PPOX class probable FMN-dependent enzyme
MQYKNPKLANRLSFEDPEGSTAMEVASGYPALREILTTENEVEAILGKANSRAVGKVIDRLDDICIAFIRRSPFVVVCSCDGAGRMDVSPKGDPAGFVSVLDRHTLAIPERPGNRRADTFRNVVQNPRVGLIFIVPGKGETLRVSGSARVVRDLWLRERMAVAGHVPALALVVAVEEAFMHCTKCVVRSRIWQPDSWNADGLASLAEAVLAHAHLDMPLAEAEALAQNDIRTRLY